MVAVLGTDESLSLSISSIAIDTICDIWTSNKGIEENIEMLFETSINFID